MRWLVALVAVFGCDDSGPPAGLLPGSQPPPCELEPRWYVVDEVTFGESMEAWEDDAFDLDGQGGVDNQLGAAHWYFSQAVTIPSSERLRGLGTVWIVEIGECADGSSDHARVSLHEGTIAGDHYEIVTPAEVPAVGRRASGLVYADAGIGVAPVPALFELDATMVGPWLETWGTRFRVKADDIDMSGNLGFGVEAGLARAPLADAFARLYSAILAADPDCAPTGGLCDSVLSAIALGFDADGDRAISSDEFMAEFPDRVGQQYLLPDADVLSGGDYWPGHDGDPDCLSLGFTFHGVSAVVEPGMPGTMP